MKCFNYSRQVPGQSKSGPSGFLWWWAWQTIELLKDLIVLLIQN